ncbi:MAG: ABC transporter substrate-binding protein [Clostridiales bacterium]|jgi:branched-chain amino acid transport system substrate-binding protein|nr:ABC transporter substrate-binding protein [Clostridiales bacterium]
MKLNKFIRTGALLLTFLTAAAALASCGGAGSSDKIKLGGIGPLTGGAAIYGSACKNAAEIAVEEINALGGLQFELNFQDDEHDAEKSVNAYNTLKDWGMQVLVGTTTTTPCIAVSAEAYNDHLFVLTPSASSEKVVELDTNADGTVNYKGNIFQMCFTDPNQGSASAQYINDKGLGSKIAIIYKNDDPYSKGIYERFIAKAAELGVSVVSETSFTDDSANDFSVQLSQAQAAGADLVFLPMYYTPASLILTQAHNMNYTPKFFGVDGLDGILTMEGFDTALAEGVMLLTPFSADAADERTQNFVKKYQEKYGDIPNQFAADTYDVVYSIYQACNNAGVTSSMSYKEICDKLTEQFTTMTYDGLTGAGMTWAPSGMVSKEPRGMIIKDGAYVGMD